jgi:hypothetical protein
MGEILLLLTQSLVYVLASLVAFVVCTIVLRWALRINELVALQREILENLRHINAHTKQGD